MAAPGGGSAVDRIREGTRCELEVRKRHGEGDMGPKH